jgi:OOP family OmpA-OmpF porin
MKLLLSVFAMLSISMLLSAEEYSYIEPYAVEEAPKEVLKPVPKIEEPDMIKVVQEEKAQELDESVKDTVDRGDDDGDGIINEKDQCPNTSRDFLVDGYGCPQTMVLHIKFPSGKATITHDVIKQLEDFAKFLQENPGYQVIVYGYTDNIGNEDMNLELSKTRAKAVVKALSQYGLDESRFTAIGKGEQEPVADNSTPEGRAENRRIEIELIQ